MSRDRRWAQGLVVLGGIAMVLGAVDPLEGSLLILPGSGLFALGAYLGRDDRRVAGFRVAVFILIGIGVGALWVLSAGGGLGGSTGPSMWWGVLVLPYMIGWSMGVWGPGSPRWMLWLGIAVGVWYLTILAMVLRSSARHGATMPVAVGIVVGAVGLLTIGGCIIRLRRQASP